MRSVPFYVWPLTRYEGVSNEMTQRQPLGTIRGMLAALSKAKTVPARHNSAAYDTGATRTYTSRHSRRSFGPQ